jgi:hypothetical protein
MPSRILASIFFVSILTLTATACSILNVARASKPVVVIASPPSGSQFNAGDDVNVQSTSTDATGVVRVELVVDSATVASETTPLAQGQPSFSVIQKWKAAPGTHTIIVRAVNTAGATSDPVAILVTVSAGTAPSATAAATLAVPNATATSAATPTTSPPATDIPNISATSAVPPLPSAQPVCSGIPVFSSFTVSPATITDGSSATLNWGAVKNATAAIIDHGIGGVPTPGNKKVNPTTTTTYTLTATGCGGTVTAQVTVTVTPKIPATVQVVFGKTSVPPAAGTAQADADCPSGTKVTGGGFLSVDGYGVFTYKSSMHNNGWEALAENDTSQSHDFQAYAVCVSNLSGSVHEVSQTTTVGGSGAIGLTTAHCPSGSISTGGGFAASAPLQFISSTLSGGDSGWESSAANNGSASLKLSVYAICYDGPGASSSTAINSFLLDASDTGGAAHATCPSGALLTGGGFRGDTDLIIMNAFPPAPPQPPTDWLVGVRKPAPVSKTLQVIAICTKF